MSQFKQRLIESQAKIHQSFRKMQTSFEPIHLTMKVNFDQLKSKFPKPKPTEFTNVSIDSDSSNKTNSSASNGNELPEDFLSNTESTIKDAEDIQRRESVSTFSSNNSTLVDDSNRNDSSSSSAIKSSSKFRSFCANFSKKCFAWNLKDSMLDDTKLIGSFTNQEEQPKEIEKSTGKLGSWRAFVEKVQNRFKSGTKEPMVANKKKRAKKQVRFEEPKKKWKKKKSTKRGAKIKPFKNQRKKKPNPNQPNKSQEEQGYFWRKARSKLTKVVLFVSLASLCCTKPFENFVNLGEKVFFVSKLYYGFSNF